MAMATEYDFQENRFSALDYVVFAIVLAIASVIGLFYGCTGNKQSSTAEFLMAGRSMSVLPVALSLLASFMSAILLLGTPAEIVIYGTQYWMICICYCFVIPIAAYVFLPVFYRLQVTSVFEYLEKRFCRGVRIYGAVVYIIQMIMYMALVLYTPCLALSVVTGLNKWIAVFSVGIVCTFYTTIGGMKAVMWTDVVQVCFMFAGIVAVIIKGSVDHGGFSNIWSTMSDGERIQFWDFNPNPLTRHTVWSLVIGGTVTWLAIYGVNQAQVQRALCTPSCRKGQIAMWINVPGLIMLVTICSLAGMVVYAEYHRCDPLATDRIHASDQLLPLYVMDRMYYPGFPGLFTACVFSGALSTISSGLNSLAAVCLQDLLRLLCFKDMSEKRATLASKLISVGFGVLMMLLTFVAAELGGVLQAALTLFGMISGPVLGLFILGIIYPWTNYKGAYFGISVGLVLTMWVGIGAQVYKPPVLGHIPPPMKTDECPYKNITVNNSDSFTSTTYQSQQSSTDGPALSAGVENRSGYVPIYQMSYMWYGPFAVFVTTVSGLLVSFLTGYTRPSQLDPELLCPIVYVCCRCLPKSWSICVDRRKKKMADKVRPPSAPVLMNGHAAAGRAEPGPRPLTAAEYAGTVTGFVNLTNSFDSGIDVVESVMGSAYF